MKKSMLIAIFALTAIIIMSSFGLQLDPIDTTNEIPEAFSANVLYVCPAASQTWDSLATAMNSFKRFFTVSLASCVIVLAFTWGWAFYQNLLKDKFDGDKYKTPWEFTKMLFWATVIIIMMMMTPNYFKSVHINGVTKDYVLCEVGDKNASPVRADIVSH